MSKGTLKTASVLAFERSFNVSDGLFYQTDWVRRDLFEKIRVIEKSIRGTISHRLKNSIINEPAKLNSEIQKVNLQSLDVATLNYENDTLVVRWGLKIQPFTGTPCACNNIIYQRRLELTLAEYINNVGFKELAKRYALNIANARFLWRNRISAECIDVVVHLENDIPLIFDSKAYSLNSFDYTDDALVKLASYIQQGLNGKRFVLLKIDTYAKVGHGQEVYPSQDLILDKSKKSKRLYQINGTAAMHSQKMSNALRTIDTWYPEARFPIAVEPYGTVTLMGTAFRQPKAKTDFYTLFDDWVLKGQTPSLDDQHYVMAILIRGGVFGESSKE